MASCSSKNKLCYLQYQVFSSEEISFSKEIFMEEHKICFKGLNSAGLFPIGFQDKEGGLGSEGGREEKLRPRKIRKLVEDKTVL